MDKSLEKLIENLELMKFDLVRINSIDKYHCAFSYKFKQFSINCWNSHKNIDISFNQFVNNFFWIKTMEKDREKIHTLV